MNVTECSPKYLVSRMPLYKLTEGSQGPIPSDVMGRGRVGPRGPILSGASECEGS